MRYLRIRSLILAVLLATPAAAQNLDALMAGLPTAEGQDGQMAALAACIAGKGDAEATAALFTGAGWGRDDDTEMGLVYLTAPTPGLSAMVNADGGYCEVASGSLGTPNAVGTVSKLAIMGQLPMAIAYEPECGGMTLGDALVEITSTGQDPECASETESVIRVTFPK